MEIGEFRFIWGRDIGIEILFFEDFFGSFVGCIRLYRFWR